MEVFIVLKKCFKQLGIRSEENSNFNWKNSTIIFLFACCTSAMTIFILFEGSNFIDIGTSYYGAASTGLNAIMLSFNVIKTKSIFRLINRFQEMINRRFDRRAHIYKVANNRIENWCKVSYIAYLPATIMLVYIPKFVMSYYLYFTTDLGADCFSLSFPMSMPFSWKTPIGYGITAFFLYGTWIFVLINCCCVQCFLSSVCWILMAFVEDITEDIRSLNDIINLKETRLTLKNKLYDIIQFHSFSKECVNDICDIYVITITGYYLWSISTICCTLLMFHVGTSDETTDTAELLFVACGIFWAFGQIFILCNFGENMTKDFSEIDNTIYYCNWYLFPKDVQRILPIVMLSAQQPIILTGFANFSCTREAFKKAVNGGFSYFMMLRQINI